MNYHWKNQGRLRGRGTRGLDRCRARGQVHLARGQAREFLSEITGEGRETKKLGNQRGGQTEAHRTTALQEQRHIRKPGRARPETEVNAPKPGAQIM